MTPPKKLIITVVFFPLDYNALQLVNSNEFLGRNKSGRFSRRITPHGAKWLIRLLFSAYGTSILERLPPRGPSFLASPRNEAKEGDPGQHETPHCGQSRRRLRDSLRSNILAETPPRLFLASACFKGTLKPRAKSAFIAFPTVC